MIVKDIFIYVYERRAVDRKGNKIGVF